MSNRAIALDTLSSWLELSTKQSWVGAKKVCVYSKRLGRPRETQSYNSLTMTGWKLISCWVFSKLQQYGVVFAVTRIWIARLEVQLTSWFSCLVLNGYLFSTTMVQRLGIKVYGLIQYIQMFEDVKWTKGWRKERTRETILIYLGGNKIKSLHTCRWGNRVSVGNCTDYFSRYSKVESRLQRLKPDCSQSHRDWRNRESITQSNFISLSPSQRSWSWAIIRANSKLKAKDWEESTRISVRDECLVVSGIYAKYRELSQGAMLKWVSGYDISAHYKEARCPDLYSTLLNSGIIVSSMYGKLLHLFRLLQTRGWYSILLPSTMFMESQRLREHGNDTTKSFQCIIFN